MVEEQTENSDAEVDGCSVSEEDRRLLAGVDQAIAAARDLQRWWRRAEAGNNYQDRFELSATYSPPDNSFGFFDQAEVGGQKMPIMGLVQERLFDRLKTAGKSAAARAKAAKWLTRQTREFVLRYLMRVSAFSLPRAVSRDKKGAPSGVLRPFGWAPFDDEPEAGFGFEQVFYKRVGADEPKRFSDGERFAIVDLRDVGEIYDWIVVKVDVFEHAFSLEPFGQGHDQGSALGSEASWVVLCRDFIRDQENGDGAGELGCYGYGFGFLAGVRDSLVAYGPGRFEAAFQTIHFHVGADGEVVSRLVFVANRLKKMVDVSVDPVSWSLRLADMLSFGAASPIIEPMQKMWNRMPRPGGADLARAYLTMAGMVNSVANSGAARSLGVSKKQLEKGFLASHFSQQYNLVAGSLLTWRQIRDWTREEDLPRWVVSGRGG